MNKILSIGLIAALALGVLTVAGFATTAEAAIECQTKSGNAPGGQQDGKDDCQGNKLRVTPSGNAPPGQNP